MAGLVPAMTAQAPSLARRGVLDLQLAHLAGDDELAVVERERARDAVLVELEADRIDRRLLALLLLGAVEIADRDRPAREAGERGLARGRVGRLLLVGLDLAADHGERAVDLLAGLRAVVDRQLQNALALARGLDDAPHVLGRKHHRALEIEGFFRRLRKLHGDARVASISVAVDRLHRELVDEILRIEAEALGAALLPRAGAQIAQRRLALAAVELRDLAAIERIAVAGAAGEIVENAPAHRPHRALALRAQERKLVDGPARPPHDPSPLPRPGPPPHPPPTPPP